MTKMEYAQTIAEEIGGKVTEVNKNGITYTGIYKETGAQVTPVVYIDDAYNNNYTVEEGIAMVNNTINENANVMVNIGDITDYEKIKGRIEVRLCSADTEAEVYESATQYGFPGLKIVPYVTVEMIGNEDMKGAFKITKSIMENLYDVSLKQIIYQGFNNFEIKIASMEELFGLPAPFMVLTNTNMHYGAIAGIIAKSKLEEMFPDGYIVIPSSIHEVLVMDKNDVDDMEYMIDMVRDINAAMVAPAERLADAVYEF